jgi:hypothetical protein
MAVRHPNLLLKKDGVLVHRVVKGQNRFACSAHEVPVALRIKNAWILVGAEVVEFVFDTNLFLKLGDDHQSAERRLSRRYKKAMISPSIGAGEAGRCISANSVRDKPFMPGT